MSTNGYKDIAWNDTDPSTVDDVCHPLLDKGKTVNAETADHPDDQTNILLTEQPVKKELIFDKNNRILSFKDVTVTISKEDIQDDTLECTVSIIQNENYIREKTILPIDEQIVAPVTEFLFPKKHCFQQFVAVDMVVEVPTLVRVWRISQHMSGKYKLQEILQKGEVNIDAPEIDAYFIFTKPGKIRIFLKKFCILVCTCKKQHEGFSLSAYMYIVPQPSLDYSKSIRVTLYILDGVQTENNFKCNQDEQDIEPVRKRINLPDTVQLADDKLRIKLTLTPVCNEQHWKQTDSQQTQDEMEVSLRNITQCQDARPNPTAFSIDWHFTSVAVENLPDKIIFRCTIDIRVLGLFDECATNKFVLCKQFDMGIKAQGSVSDESIVRAEMYNPSL